MEAFLAGIGRLVASGRTSTHFYEYYWAHKVQGTKLGHLLGKDEHAITHGPRPSATEALRWAIDLNGLRRFRSAGVKQGLAQVEA